MYAPATPALPAQPLAPVGIVSEAARSAIATVHTGLKLDSTRLNVLAGQRASVTGALLEDHRPGAPGQLVALQALMGRRWHTLARALTRAGGRFRLSYAPWRLGSEWVRLRFAGAPGRLAAHRRLPRD